MQTILRALAAHTRAATLFAALLLAGCAAQTAVKSSTWHEPAQRGARYSKALVVALTNEGDKRLSFEDKLADGLSSDTTVAWPSSRFMDTSQPVTATTLAPVIQRTGAEVVIATRVTGFEVQSIEKSAPYTDVSARRRSGTLFQYDYVEKQLPAVITAEFTTELTTDVVDARSGKLIYTVVTAASGQETLADVIDVLSKVIAQQLRTDGVIR